MDFPAEIIWLDEDRALDSSRVGCKAANLATMLRNHLPVPYGFCLSTQAFGKLTVYLGGNPSEAIPPPPAESVAQWLPEQWRQSIRTSYYRLGAKQVAVRSSATTEDSPKASFAGQQQSILNVQNENELFEAIITCWRSLWTNRATHYRQHRLPNDPIPGMAVIVQTMIACDIAGVAFSVDPVNGAETIVIEAAAGLGERVVGGMEAVQRYAVARTDLRILKQPQQSLLSPAQAGEVARLVLSVEQLFNCPQDVEWGFCQKTLYALQSRPITVLHRNFFHDIIPKDDHLWTNAFLSERFPQPVSPLGWTLIRDLLEPLAFLDPIKYLGCKLPADFPVTKLYRGHPYVNAQLFAIFYRPFPDRLIPEDAQRFFPPGDIQFRKQSFRPQALWTPRVLGSLLWHGLRDPANWSPWHNHQMWKHYLENHRRFMKWLIEQADLLPNDHSSLPQKISVVLKAAQSQSRRLLSIHRWSLLHAEVFYTLLMKLLATWLGPSETAELAPLLIAGLPNKSLELNLALASIRNAHDLEAFLQFYGHRSYSLDVYHPTFAEIPDEIGAFDVARASGLPAAKLRQAGQPRSEGSESNDVASSSPSISSTRSQRRKAALEKIRHRIHDQSFAWIRNYLFTIILEMTEYYVVLREEQRFYWQEILARQRNLLLRLGEYWFKNGRLTNINLIFFATCDDVLRATEGGPLDISILEERLRRFEQLKRDFQLAPGLSYPAFLRGNDPIYPNRSHSSLLEGIPVSPGVAQGPARVILFPGQLPQVQAGEVLVTVGADPGWTPVFSRIAGLVMESGGQLSHGAVVAREYGLPAVTGIPQVTQQVAQGQRIRVDGTTGIVEKLD